MFVDGAVYEPTQVREQLMVPVEGSQLEVPDIVVVAAPVGLTNIDLFVPLSTLAVKNAVITCPATRAVVEEIGLELSIVVLAVTVLPPEEGQVVLQESPVRQIVVAAKLVDVALVDVAFLATNRSVEDAVPRVSSLV